MFASPGICQASQGRQSPPEWWKMKVDTAVLRLIAEGFDLEKFALFYGKQAVETARIRLILQGCLDLQGQVTDLGREILDLNCHIPFGIMLIEAIERGVVNDVATIAAYLQAGSIAISDAVESWSEYVDPDEASDALTQVRLFNLYKEMTSAEQQAHWINDAVFWKVSHRRELMIDRLWRRFEEEEDDSSDPRQDTIACIIKGLALYTYQYDQRGMYLRPGDPYYRPLAYESLIGKPTWVVGYPVDFTYRDGGVSARFIRGATRVSSNDLRELAPHFLHTTVESLRYDPDDATVVCLREHKFLGHRLSAGIETDRGHPQLDVLKQKHELEQKATRIQRQIMYLFDAYASWPYFAPHLDDLETLSVRDLRCLNFEELGQWMETAREILARVRLVLKDAKPPVQTKRPLAQKFQPHDAKKFKKKAVKSLPPPPPVCMLRQELRLTINEAKRLQETIAGNKMTFDAASARDSLREELFILLRNLNFLLDFGTDHLLLNETLLRATWIEVILSNERISPDQRLIEYPKGFDCVVLIGKEQLWRKRFTLQLHSRLHEWNELQREVNEQRRADEERAKVAAKQEKQLKAQAAAAAKKKPVELIYTLCHDFRLTFVESEFFMGLAHAGNIHVRSKFSSQARMLDHLLECGFCSEQPDGRILLQEQMLNQSVFNILDEVDVQLRLADARPNTQQTSKHWKVRLERAIKNARARRSAPRTPRRPAIIQNHFLLSQTEASSFVALMLTSPFTFSEMEKTLGDCLMRELRNSGFIDPQSGWLDIGKMVYTNFIISTQIPTGSRFTSLAQVDWQEQYNGWWLDNLRVQLLVS